jgi:hypothetical protein
VPLAVGAWLGHLLRRIVEVRVKTLVVLLALLPPAGAALESALVPPATDVTVVATEERIAAPRELVWKHLVFFEETSDDLPWWFRIGLPRPLGTRPGGADGSEQVCVYTTGHLKKRVVERAEALRLDFVVTEQAIGFEHDVRLLGGSFDLEDDRAGGTVLRLTTRYVGIPRPAVVWRTVEGWALTTLHRHVIRAVREGCERDVGRVEVGER